MLDNENNHVGYLPNYYSESIVGYLKENMEYECIVLEVNKDMNCNECVKVKLLIQCEVPHFENIS